MTGSAQAKAQPVTNEVLSLQLEHLQGSVDKITTRIDRHDERIRSVEDDRLRAWTVVGIISVMGVSFVAAIFKWIMTN